MENGISLAECLIGMSLVLTLTTVAAPAVSSLITQNQLSTATLQLQQDMNHARYLAVIRQQPISIKPLEKNCWHCGWQIHTTDLQTLVARSALSTPIDITSNSPWQAGATFMPNGAAIQKGGAFAAGSFLICATNSSHHFKVIISKSGRTRVKRELTPCL